MKYAICALVISCGLGASYQMVSPERAQSKVEKNELKNVKQPTIQSWNHFPKEQTQSKSSE